MKPIAKIQVIARVRACGPIETVEVDAYFQTQNFCVNKSQEWIKRCPNASLPLLGMMPTDETYMDPHGIAHLHHPKDILADCYWVVTHKASGWTIVRMLPGQGFAHARKACQIAEHAFGNADLPNKATWPEKRRYLAAGVVSGLRTGTLNLSSEEIAYLQGKIPSVVL